MRVSCVYLCSLLAFFPIFAKNGLMYEKNAGRLGDNILNYAKHLYIAHKHDLDLYIREFNYMDEFMLEQQEQLASDQIIKRYKKRLKIKNESQINHTDTDMLYMGDYYTIIDNIRDTDYWHHYLFKRSIESPSFGTLIKERLALKHRASIYLPTDRVSVAVHVRKGGGFDHPLASQSYKGNEHIKRASRLYADKGHPLKFPPEQYYIEQLRYLYALLEEQPLYVYIFTDDKNPAGIVARFKQQLSTENIVFDCRQEGNVHNQNVVVDIDAMSQFDYLIRSGSHFPWVAQMIGNHKAIIYPKKARWEGNFLRVTVVEMIIPNRDAHNIKTSILNA